MTRAIVHAGLAVAFVLAPALCCCKAGWLSTPARAAHISTPAPHATVPPIESHCLKAKKTCCDETVKTKHEHSSTPSEKPAPGHAPECACCAERPDATPPESKITETTPQTTGEFLSLALAGLLTPLEHLASGCGFHPPDGAGVDARYAALFERHVLRC